MRSPGHHEDSRGGWAVDLARGRRSMLARKYCASCHEAQARSYSSSGMSRALQSVTDSYVLRKKPRLEFSDGVTGIQSSAAARGPSTRSPMEVTRSGKLICYSHSDEAMSDKPSYSGNGVNITKVASATSKRSVNSSLPSDHELGNQQRFRKLSEGD